MTCTSAMPCLSSGLAKNNKIISMFVLFYQLFWPFSKFDFYRKREGKPYIKAVKQNLLVNFLKFATIM